MLRDTAIHKRLYVKVARYRPRRSVFAFISKDGSVSLNAQIGHLRKAADERVGHAVREIIDISIAAFVDERHHRDRVDLLRVCAEIASSKKSSYEQKRADNNSTEKSERDPTCRASTRFAETGNIGGVDLRLCCRL